MLLGIYQLFPSHLENLNDFSLAAMIKFEMEWNWTKHTQLFSRESELKALLMAVLWVVRIFIFSIVLFTIEWQLGANAEGGKYFIWSIQSLFSLAHLFCFIHFIVFSTGRSSGSIQMSERSSPGRSQWASREMIQTRPKKKSSKWVQKLSIINVPLFQSPLSLGNLAEEIIQQD